MEVMISRISEDEKEIVDIILITNKTYTKNHRIIHICKIMLDFFVQFLIGS